MCFAQKCVHTIIYSTIDKRGLKSVTNKRRRIYYTTEAHRNSQHRFRWVSRSISIWYIKHFASWLIETSLNLNNWKRNSKQQAKLTLLLFPYFITLCHLFNLLLLNRHNPLYIATATNYV